MSNKKAPTETPISCGAMLYTAEAMQTSNSSIALPVVKPQQEISHDLPQLQNRSGKGR